MLRIEKGIDCRLPGALCIEISPAMSKGTVMNLDAVAGATKHAKIGAAFELKRHVIRIFG